jgi:serine/threonine protein kinase
MTARIGVLPPGTRLEEFEILGMVGEGGFGIVYRARDHMLQRDVALKEYMPSALAMRIDPMAVSVKSEDLAGAFVAGLKSFINEARLLAQFDHPSLVKVYRFWEANGTAYMVMPFYEGVTLRTALARGGPPTEGWLKDLLRPLLEALAYLHRAGCLHRDIAPDNIMILQDGRPLLLDFGAARQVIGDHRRYDAGVDRDPEAGLRTGRAIRRDVGHDAGTMDGHLRPGLRRVLRDHDNDAGSIRGAPAVRFTGAAEPACRRPLRQAIPPGHRQGARREAGGETAGRRRVAHPPSTPATPRPPRTKLLVWYASSNVALIAAVAGAWFLIASATRPPGTAPRPAVPDRRAPSVVERPDPTPRSDLLPSPLPPDVHNEPPAPEKQKPPGVAQRPAPRPSPSRQAWPPQCSAILERGSLEPLTEKEKAPLRECR